MIRHSSSLLVSIIIHIVLFFTLVFLNNNYVKKKVTICEQKTSIKLNNYVYSKKQEIKPKVIKKEIKKNTNVVKKKKVLKTKPKPIAKQKPKIENPKKIIPVISDVTKVIEEEIIKEVKEEKITSKENVAKKYIQDNISKIAKLLQENLYYPRRARKKGITGEVIVKFTLELDSSVNNIKIITSNKEILSRAAIKTIQDLSGEFPSPKEQLTIEVPINYSLK
jgi:protein TonB